MKDSDGKDYTPESFARALLEAMKREGFTDINWKDVDAVAASHNRLAELSDDQYALRVLIGGLLKN